MSQPIRVYNTLSRTKEPFQPFEDNHVRIYACGVTPYADAHIGHARPTLIWSVIRKYLRMRGYRVSLVQNFTDVDDKIIERASAEGIDALQLAARYSRKYLESMRRLGIEDADHYPLVSEHIPDIIEMIEALVERGFAYAVDGDVFYDVTRFRDYGKLSGQRLDELMAGTRFETDERKRNPMDFALWKAAKPGEPAWDSPWGPGRPGWHIECSAMSLKYLGNHIDFHGGGIDLVFPHHENEIAQSEAYTGIAPFVRFWVHNGLVNMEAEKMSKSLGNVVSVETLLEKYPAPLLRFFLLNTHYRSPLELSDEMLEDAGRGWRRLVDAVKELRAFLQERGISRGSEGTETSAGDAAGDAAGHAAGDAAGDATGHAAGHATGDAAPGTGAAPELGDRTSALSSTVDVEAFRADLDAAGRRYAEVVSSTPRRFDEAMADDFNTALAMAVLFDLARATNAFRQHLAGRGAEVTGAEATLLLEAERSFALFGDELLGVLDDGDATSSDRGGVDGRLTEALITLLLDVRQQARKARDWAMADGIRDRLHELGIVIEDTPDGSRWSVRRDV